ncbi:MAG: hypothetical protein A2V99_04280 [Spirochaetes bacterium RBG_16_67_19]|nr:MAG: hypothetical protein A2V99_04280 [Spirochaetes bacterium RBG_16_67_19]
MMIGTTEIIVIAVAALVLFGATALPKFARSLGQAKKEFQKGIKEGAASETEDEPEKETPKASSGRGKKPKRKKQSPKQSRKS